MTIAKICHRGVYIERQLQPGGVYLWICHTGINRFLPDLYETQERAMRAVDEKWQSNFLLQTTPKRTHDTNLKAQ